jgi:hypothetical protein
MRLALLLAVLAPIVVPSEKTSWVRARSEHFDLVSAAGGRRTREIAADLEAFAATLQRLHPRLQKSGKPTRVLVFARRDEAQAIFDHLAGREATHAAGMFVRRTGEPGTMIVDASADWRSDRVVLHELVHDLLSSAGTRPPLWLEEGLAEYFSARGLPIREHRFLLARRGTIPLEQLFAVKFESESALDPLFYAESWAAVSWLMQSPTFDQFLDDAEHGMTIDTALRKNYNRSLGDLQHAIAATASTRQRPSPLTPVMIDRVDTPVAIADLPRADALFELAQFLAVVPGAEEDRRRMYDAALAADPKHTATLVALGRFDDALVAAPDDAALQLTAAESLLAKALGAQAEIATDYDPSAFRKARALGEKARTLGGDPLRVAIVLGTSWLAENDPTPGIEPLRTAHELAPERRDVALHLMALLYRKEDLAAAEALYAALSTTGDEQAVLTARNVLQRETLRRANALIAGQKIAEAAEVVRALAPRLGPSSKRDLEQQVRELTELAETNRQLALYNRAVDEANRAEWKAAQKTLDELLATATVDSIIEDARKLQKELLRHH